MGIPCPSCRSVGFHFQTATQCRQPAWTSGQQDLVLGPLLDLACLINRAAQSGPACVRGHLACPFLVRRASLRKHEYRGPRLVSPICRRCLAAHARGFCCITSHCNNRRLSRHAPFGKLFRSVLFSAHTTPSQEAAIPVLVALEALCIISSLHNLPCRGTIRPIL
jgi:hypothetical protein